MDLFSLGTTFNFSPVSVVSAFLLIIISILYLKLQSKTPGPWGLPYLGYWPLLKDETAHLKLQEFMKKYGDVYSLTYAGKLYIHLGSLKSVKEALITKSNNFTERFSGFSLITSLFNEGVAAQNGEAWRVLRKFFISTFRELGATSVKDYMSGPILDSVKAAVDDLRVKDGAPVEIISLLTNRNCGILRRILFNDTGITDDELEEIIREYEKVIPAFTNTSTMLNGQFAKYFIFPFSKMFKNACESHKKIISVLKKIIRRHETAFDKDNIRDIIDYFIKERNERKNKGDPTWKYFTENALVSSLLQFVGDGTSAVVVFIAYFINSLIEYPEEQEKIFQELEEVVGLDRQPTLEDKNKLLYLNAFMQEVQRMSDFLNLFVNVECNNETVLLGRTIPKGALILLNLWACHRDPNVFDEPNEFKPSRYLAQSEKNKTEAPIMFGIGKRSCIGEPFTMMQTYLFLATIIKNFRLVRAEGNTKKPFPDLEMQICAYPRKQ